MVKGLLEIQLLVRSVQSCFVLVVCNFVAVVVVVVVVVTSPADCLYGGGGRCPKAVRNSTKLSLFWITSDLSLELLKYGWHSVAHFWAEKK